MHFYIVKFNLQYPLHRKGRNFWPKNSDFAIFSVHFEHFCLTFYFLITLNNWRKVLQLKTLLKISESHQTLVKSVEPLSDACGLRACRSGTRELSIKSYRICLLCVHSRESCEVCFIKMKYYQSVKIFVEPSFSKVDLR